MYNGSFVGLALVPAAVFFAPKRATLSYFLIGTAIMLLVTPLIVGLAMAIFCLSYWRHG
jgi:hypothetical protein